MGQRNQQYQLSPIETHMLILKDGNHTLMNTMQNCLKNCN